MVASGVEGALEVDPVRRVLASSEGAYLGSTDKNNTESQQSLDVFGRLAFCRVKLGESSVCHSCLDASELKVVLDADACTCEWMLLRFLGIESAGHSNAFP